MQITNEPDSLPFDETTEDTYFKAFLIPEAKFNPFIEQRFKGRLFDIQRNEKPWLPAQKLIDELQDCYYFDYGTASNTNFTYDKQIGGTMVYFKLSCQRVEERLFIGMATYDSKFKLKDIEHTETIRQSSGWWLWKKASMKQGKLLVFVLILQNKFKKIKCF